MCCTMSSCCWSALSDCSLSVTFSLGWEGFHLAIVGAQTLLLSLPVTNVIGPLLLASAFAAPPAPLLGPPRAPCSPDGRIPPQVAVPSATATSVANRTCVRRLMICRAIRPSPSLSGRAGGRLASALREVRPRVKALTHGPARHAATTAVTIL